MQHFESPASGQGKHTHTHKILIHSTNFIYDILATLFLDKPHRHLRGCGGGREGCLTLKIIFTHF